MNQYDKILNKMLLEYSMYSLFMIGIILVMFFVEDINKGKIILKLRRLNDYEPIIWIATILLTVLIIFAIYPTVQDYTKQDFQIGEGVINAINVNNSPFTEDILIDGQYYKLSSSLNITRDDIDSKCKFVFTKRKRFILEIETKD